MRVTRNGKISREKSKLYFLHIPKTAGTSISAMLGDIAQNKGMTFQSPFLLDHLEKSSGWKDVNILSGHLALLPLKYDFKYFTIIREPVERLYSYYKHVERDEAHYFNKLLTEQNLNFEQWLTHPLTKDLNYNLQTRYVTKVPRMSFLSRKTQSKEDWAIQREFENKPFVKVNLSKALYRLANAEWVGTPKDLESLAIFLSNRYEIDYCPIPKLNTDTTPRRIFSDSELAAAEPLIGFDMKLYEFAPKKIT